MLPRKIAPVLRSRLASFPAVALVGPRQCGKTTLARSLGGSHYDLEQETERLRLDLEWESCLAGGDLVVLDEAQAWPEVFPRLRGAIDADRHRNSRRWRARHLRTADQREIDLLLEVDSQLWALEIKLTARPGPQDLARLNRNADLVGADRRFLVCRHSERMENETQVVCDLAGLVECIDRSS